MTRCRYNSPCDAMKGITLFFYAQIGKYYLLCHFLRTRIVDSASTNYCLKWNSDSAYLRRNEATGFEYMHRSRFHERWFCLVHLVAPKGMAQAPTFCYFLLSLLRFNMFLYLKLVGILGQIVLMKTR